MGVLMVYRIDCRHCGEAATSTTFDMTNPDDDGAVHVDVELSVAGTTFTCEGCGCSFTVGDLEIVSEDEECPILVEGGDG